mmetsp:Transcript_22784/g.53281  ORF Transcript_22784/g.53281 Transcript_22784/m.53281 type:complete len:140 (+) Transcript_22784:84-503(+)|eukprot:CAMPEP_0171108718 /NCGR_PEP_ID=MMETSP0766_2-20121228/69473_1 /TAXON_ID=439317 /ORGANISM="Gambierdiscus australes, Strain CAWD 149" /LENGTH=139 /DNA_ID=CAMNT_0011570305 /DNA_START=74 /DNA_END=493 /DNA_ORIENTATION=+
MVLPKLGAPMKAAKAMKAMKAKRVSKIARGRLAKVLVFKGRREQTVGGLKAEALTVNKRGRVVSKRKSALCRRNYLKGAVEWTECVMAARVALHATGFLAVNGKSLKGKALYVKAKAMHEQKLRTRGVPSSAASSEAAA